LWVRGVKEARRGCPLTGAMLCRAASYRAVPTASERRSREGPAWKPVGPVGTWALPLHPSLRPLRLCPALLFSLQTSTWLESPGQAQPSRARRDIRAQPSPGESVQGCPQPAGEGGWWLACPTLWVSLRWNKIPRRPAQTTHCGIWKSLLPWPQVLSVNKFCQPTCHLHRRKDGASPEPGICGGLAQLLAPLRALGWSPPCGGGGGRAGVCCEEPHCVNALC